MFKLKKIVLYCFVLFGVKSENEVTFKNVIIKWKTTTEEQSLEIKSSDNLQQNLSNNSSELMSVTVNGIIPVLHRNSIANIPYLETLTISNVGLQEIQPGAINNLPNLTYLTLNHNNLTDIKTDTFVNLKLSSLNLANNFIRTIEPSAFQNLEIKHMSLSDNKIEKLENKVFENVSLESLLLYNNGLHKIAPEAFKSVENLVSLTLSSNKLAKINPDVFNFESLKFLDLNFNSITSLQPGDLRNMPQLDNLELVGNQLNEIKEGVFNGSLLTFLKLNYNKISKIAPKSFDDMHNLSVLHIDHNNLTIWDNEWLNNSTRLAYLIAGENNFEKLPGEAFKNYPKLYSINLQKSNIRIISPDAFVKLHSVVNFGLNDNEIEFWDRTLLKDAHIGTLDLSNNKLKCIAEDLEDTFKNVGFVHFDGNPWNQQCAKNIDDFVKERENNPKRTI